MDRKSWLGVVVCMVLLVGWNFYAEYRWPRPLPKKPVATAPSAAPATTNSPAAASDVPSLGNAAPSVKPLLPKIPVNAGVEQKAELENDNMIVRFSSWGGAIRSIELKKHADEGDKKITLNYGPVGIFNLAGWDGEFNQVPYALEKQGDAVLFKRTLDSGAVLVRTYRLGDNYQVVLSQQVVNPTAKELVLPSYRLNVGTITPVHVRDNAIYIVGSYCLERGASFHKVTPSSFAAGGFLGFFEHPAKDTITTEDGPLLWAAVNNQFYTMIATPQEKLTFKSAEFHPVKLTDFGPKSSTVLEGIRVEGVMEGLTLPAGQIIDQSLSLYAGPKEYAKLDLLPRHENLIMDSWFWWIVKPLLVGMNTIHKAIPSWGWTIVVMTILIKLALWPLQSIANKSMKKMQALQPKMEQLRQKYKDDPQKMNIETMNMYREYGVNPAGGCLPMLVQMPIFIGFYVMLQSAVELRGASFLWIHDLVQPDTIASFMFAGYHIDINPLPILMTATQVLVMKMTPQSSDNPQMKMMQWMPVVLLFVLYNFAAALALYWTISNIISMVQTYLNLRTPVPVLKRVPKTKQP